MAEFIYILQNRAIDLEVRIIRSDKDAPDLPKYLLYCPGIRPPFTVFLKYAVTDGLEAERRIHHHLAACRNLSDPTLFAIDVWQAGPLLDSLLLDLLAPPTVAPQDTQRQDELLAAATQIAISMGTVWPSSLAGPLSISFEEAQELLRKLQARGVIDEKLELCPAYHALHMEQEAQKASQRAVAEVKPFAAGPDCWGVSVEQNTPPAATPAPANLSEAVRRKKEAAQGAAVAQANPELVQTVNSLLAGLADPNTGEAVEIRFVDDNGQLAVDIRGTEWVRLEAQKRLSVLYDTPSSTEA